MPTSRRALQLLDESIASLEVMAESKEPREPLKLDRLFGDLRSIRRSMRRLAEAGASANFWRMQRRSVVLMIKIAKHLSTS